MQRRPPHGAIFRVSDPVAWSYEQVNLSKPSEFAESTQVYYSSLSASRRMSASWTLRGHQTCAVGCLDTGSTVLSNGDNKERSICFLLIRISELRHREL